MSAKAESADSVHWSSRQYRLLFVAVLVALHGLIGWFPEILHIFGVAKLGLWFRDSYAMLAASDSAQAGFNPFVFNPFDLIGERHIYSDWWYLLGDFGLNRSHYLWVGGAVVVAFWTAVVLVLPFRSRREFWWSLAICGSPPFWLAVNRANPDILLFAILTMTVPLLMHRRLWVRLLSPLPVALAIGLKYFPIVAGIVLLTPGRDKRENILRAIVIAVLGIFLTWSLWDAVKNYLDVSWIARGQFIFGASAIPRNFSMDMDIWLWVGRATGLLVVVLALSRFGGESNATVESKTIQNDRLYALMGTAVVAGNFFLTIGFLYKVIFAVWVLPQCLRLSGLNEPWSRSSRWALWGMVALVWMEGLGCVSSFQWLPWVGPEAEAPVRRAISTLAGLLAWGMMVPLVMMFGHNLKACWDAKKTTLTT